MSVRSRAKRAARQHKHSHKWDKNPTGGLWVIEKANFDQNIAQCQLKEDQRFDISKAGWASLTVIASHPNANSDHWADLATISNLALMLAEQGYGQEHELVFKRAQEALVKMYERGMAKNSWRLDGQGIQDVRDMLELHDLQCELVTHGDIKKALIEVHKRVIDGEVFQFKFSEAA